MTPHSHFMCGVSIKMNVYTLIKSVSVNYLIILLLVSYIVLMIVNHDGQSTPFIRSMIVTVYVLFCLVGFVMQMF